MNPTQIQGPDVSETARYHLTEAGHRVLDHGDKPGSVPSVLRSAALYLELHGWIQGAYYDATTGVFTPPACIVGAIAMACYGGPVDAPAQMFGEPGFAEFEAAVLHLDRYLLVEDGTEAYEFNDAKGRRVEDIVHALRQAAATPVHELLDALRAIDEMNDRLAESGATTEQVLQLFTSSNDAPCGWCDSPGGAPVCPECIEDASYDAEFIGSPQDGDA